MNHLGIYEFETGILTAGIDANRNRPRAVRTQLDAAIKFS
jgi:hypothetical protein